MVAEKEVGKMTDSEVKAYKWLLSQGVPKNEITFSPRNVVDFVVSNKELYEVKRLRNGGFRLSRRQNKEFEKLNPTILLFDNKGEDLLMVAPFNEIKQKVRVYTESVCAHKRISITVDEELLLWAADQVRAGRFANISHAFRYALKKLMEKEKGAE